MLSSTLGSTSKKGHWTAVDRNLVKKRHVLFCLSLNIMLGSNIIMHLHLNSFENNTSDFEVLN